MGRFHRHPDGTVHEHDDDHDGEHDHRDVGDHTGYVDTGADGTVLFERLLHEGVIVRPLAGFGSPSAIRISACRRRSPSIRAAWMDAVSAPCRTKAASGTPRNERPTA